MDFERSILIFSEAKAILLPIMNRAHKHQQGFTIIEVLLILLTLAIIGTVGYFVAKHADRKTTTTSTTNITTNPYRGWLTAKLQYEKASFQYPSTWKITDKSIPKGTADFVALPGFDKATISSSDGLTVTVQTGYAQSTGPGPDTYPNSPIYTQPINSLGGKYTLSYAMMPGPTSPKGYIDGVYVTIPPTNINFATDKNITNALGETTNMLISITYPNAQGNPTPKPLTTFQDDSALSTAKLIIESIRY